MESTDEMLAAARHLVDLCDKVALDNETPNEVYVEWCAAVDTLKRLVSAAERSALRPYEEIADQVPVPDLTPLERGRVSALLEAPTPEYKQLVRLLDRDGCIFPKVQAALMQLNSPGVAAQILADG